MMAGDGGENDVRTPGLATELSRLDQLIGERKSGRPVRVSLRESIRSRRKKKR
jgi:hypothetical protein